MLYVSVSLSLSVEFQFWLPAIFLQALVPNKKTSSDFLTATSLSLPLEIFINKWTVALVAVRKSPLLAIVRIQTRQRNSTFN